MYGFTLTPTLIHSQAAGSLRLHSADPFDKPEITPNYLADKTDLVQLRRGIRLVREIGAGMFSVKLWKLFVVLCRIFSQDSILDNFALIGTKRH